MQAHNVGLLGHSSSVALSTTQRPETHETVSDDMSIARELLQTGPHGRAPIPLTRQSSVSFRDGTVYKRSETAGVMRPDAGARRAIATSNTWTSSDGDVLSDQDEFDDRTVYIQEYNRLAKKHGVRTMNREHHEASVDDNNNTPEKHGWFRRILRRTSSTQSIKADRNLKHRRSISDLSLKLKIRKDKLKDKDLQELVRLCGASVLYLPAEYAAGSLSVPTCFRATAQYLVQYGTSTRGIFRIPGSHNVVAALYNHYCSTDEHGQVIASTIRCPTLPEHIRCDVHDVASAFKKFLSGLPGGILGSLPLLDALISIQTQLAGQAEATRTKQSKVRARLIALAVSTLRSYYRRELICAVFGLLCMIGRAAETARREDDRGRPLPTSDLMGYRSLGIVFGPLLVGDLLEDYTMRLADPYGGLVLLPISPPKSRKERQKKTKSGEEGSAFNTHVDKIKVANSITEMLITHWREVVRHIRNLNALRNVASTKSLVAKGPKAPLLRPSVSESFALRKPPDWGDFLVPNARRERSESPTPTQRRFWSRLSSEPLTDLLEGPIGLAKPLAASKQSGALTIRKQRSGPRAMSSQRLSTSRSLNILSPTLEEDPKDNPLDVSTQTFDTNNLADISICSSEEIGRSPSAIETLAAKFEQTQDHKKQSQKEPKCFAVPISPTRTPSRSAASAVLTEALVEATLISHSTRSKVTVLRDKPPLPATRRIHYLESENFMTKENNPNLLNPDSNIPKPAWSTKKTKISDESGNPVENHKHASLSLETRFSKQMGYDGANIPDALEEAPFHSKPNMLSSHPQFERDSRHHPTKFPRRIGGSEPGLQAKFITQHDRRASKSLYEDPRRKRNLLDWLKLPPEKDPLSRVSRDEDVASLATLAQVLDSTEVKIYLMEGSNKQANSEGDSTSQICSRVSRTRSTFEETNQKASPVVGHSRDETFQGKKQSSGTESSTREKTLHLPRPDLKPKPITTPDEQMAKEKSSLTISGSKLATRGTAIPNEAVQYKAGLQEVAHNIYKATEGPEKESSISAMSASAIRTPKVKSSHRQSLGSPNKISSLVAKFNAPNSIPPAPPLMGPSPVKDPGRRNSHDLNSSRKNSLVAPYTTNESSPTKSQKSGKSTKSEKTPQAGRSSLSRGRTTNALFHEKSSSAKNSCHIKDTKPKLPSRSSLDDPIPSRSLRKEFKLDGSQSMNPSPPSSLSLLPLASDEAIDRCAVMVDDPFTNKGNVQDLLLSKNFIALEPMPLPPHPGTKIYETPSQLSRGPDFFISPSANRRSKRQSIEVNSVPPKKNTPTSNFKSHGDRTHFLAKNGPKDPDTRASKPSEFVSMVQAVVNVPALDGPRSSVGSAGTSSNEKVLMPTGSRSSLSANSGRLQTYHPRPTTRHANAADFVHPDSPFKNEFSSPDIFTGFFSPSSSPPPDRRSSLTTAMLYHQIRDLKLQLVAKGEENRLLKQQLEALSVVNNALLQGDLKEAKIEVEAWKNRAEAAERRLELFEKPSVRSKSWLSAGDSPGRRSLQRSDSAAEGAQLANRIRKVLHDGNLDGAGSFTPCISDGSIGDVNLDDRKLPDRWNYDGSTETVVRDTKGNGSETSKIYDSSKSV